MNFKRFQSKMPDLKKTIEIDFSRYSLMFPYASTDKHLNWSKLLQTAYIFDEELLFGDPVLERSSTI